MGGKSVRLMMVAFIIISISAARAEDVSNNIIKIIVFTILIS